MSAPASTPSPLDELATALPPDHDLDLTGVLTADPLEDPIDADVLGADGLSADVDGLGADVLAEALSGDEMMAPPVISRAPLRPGDKVPPRPRPGSIPFNEKRVAELLHELEGKSETTQRPIVDELVGMGVPTIKILAKALNSGATFQVRMASATVLGEIAHEKSVAPLVQALADSSLNVQRAAANALAMVGEPAVAPLLESLKSPDDSVRRWASEVLGKLGKKEVAPELITRLPDEPVDVQKAMIVALGELGSSKATPALLGFLESENMDIVRHTAEALGKLHDRRGIDGLIKCLDSSSSDVRTAAANALVETGQTCPDAVPALTGALKSPNHGVRHLAAEALGKLKDKRAINALVYALQDRNVQVRHHAALALGKIGDAKAARHLQSLLHDPAKDVRYSAVEAVAGIGGKASLEPLANALKDSDWAVRMAAARGLGQLADAEAVPALCGTLRDPEWSVRNHTALALGTICDERSVVPLIKAVNDGREEVRRSVIESLGRLGDRRAVPALERRRKVEDEHIVSAMIDSVLPSLRKGRKVEPRTDIVAAYRPVINTQTIKPIAAVKAAKEQAAQKARASVAETLKEEGLDPEPPVDVEEVVSE